MSEDQGFMLNREGNWRRLLSYIDDNRLVTSMGINRGGPV